MAQKISKLKRSWNEAILAPVILISGPENYLAERAYQDIKELTKKKDPGYSETLLSADSYSSGELLTNVSPSLFGEAKLVKIEKVEKLTETFLKEAKEYITDPSDEVTLVLRHSGGAKGRGLLDAVRKQSPGAIEIECAEIKPRDRIGLVRDEITSRGGRIELSSLQLLVEAYQSDLAELMNAAKQLLEVSGGSIDDAAVERITGGRVEANAFRVADAAVAGNANDALVLLRQSLNTGTAAIPLLAALNLKVRTMAKVASGTYRAAEAAKVFGIAPWQAERAMRDVRGWREYDLARAVDLGAQTEMFLKGGSRSPEYALEQFVLFVAMRGR